MRRGISQHTLEKICKGEPVRAIKLAECLKVLEEYEAERADQNLQEYSRNLSVLTSSA